MKNISVLKSTTEVLNRIENYFEQHGYKNISVNYKAFTLSAEKSRFLARKKYVDVSISSPKPAISLIQMNVHSKSSSHVPGDAIEEQMLHDKIYGLF